MVKEKEAVRLAIAIPTYNEAKNIRKLLSAIKKVIAKTDVARCTVLVIDDASPDGTGSIAEESSTSMGSEAFHVEVLHREKKDGLSRAYIAGFEHLLRGDHTHVMQMDADLSHDPEYIPAMVRAARHADLVVGSRYIAGGATPDWSWNRRLLSRLGNAYARAFLGSSIHDYTGGYNLYAVGLLHALDIGRLQAEGYGFLIEFKYRALRQAGQVSEVPIVFMDRVQGTSKIPKSTMFRNLVLVPRLRFGKTR